MVEYWKEIPNTKGYYLASTSGRIRSTARSTTRGGVLKPSLNRKEYKIISLSIDGNITTKQVHGLVAKTFVPNPGNKPQVNHKDGDKLNNHYRNLEWVTNQQNRNHAVRKGLVARGERVTLSKLTENDVLEIRKRYKSEEITYSELASQYGVYKTTIGCVIRKETWKHI